jgi:integrase
VSSIRGGKRVRRKAKYYWARMPGEKPFALRLANGLHVTDEAVATSETNRLLSVRQRRAAGLIDPAVENAAIPMRVMVGRYVRHLRGRNLSRKHIDQTVQVAKWLIDNGPIDRLADFNADVLEKVLGKLASSKRSARTVNVYRRVAHSLAGWAMTFPRLIERNPVAVVERRDESSDTRKVRRALAVDEAYRLLTVAGPRRLFYAVQLWTGLRVGETTALEWRDLDLDGERPAITMRACTTKAKRADVIPLHPDLVTLLRAAKPPFVKPTDRVCDRAPRLRTLCGGHFGQGGEKATIPQG